MYCLIGTSHNNVRVMEKSRNITKLRKFGKGLKHYAIYHEYRNGKQFHNATDQEFLVEYRRDPYWAGQENLKWAAGMEELRQSMKPEEV